MRTHKIYIPLYQLLNLICFEMKHYYLKIAYKYVLQGSYDMCM